MSPVGVLGLSRVSSRSIDEALRAAASSLFGNPLGWRRTSGDALVAEIADMLGQPDESISYLLLACLERAIPVEADIVEFTRSWRLDGAKSTLRAARHKAASYPATRHRSPVVIESGIIVDVTDTGRSKFTTGIQRVARSTITRWARDHSITPVSWTRLGDQLFGATDEEIGRVILDDAVLPSIERQSSEVVIPFRATFVLPEITTEGRRTAGIQTIARYSRSRSTAIGFDCIPVTTSETSGPGMPGAFSKYLTALSSFNSIVPISDAAAIEYRGWRRMLQGAGVEGPKITVVPLPWQSEEVSQVTVDRVRKQLGLDDGRPVVVAIGSHEPRKNHLNLVTACEINWRRGHEFHLVMIGGNAWGDEEFKELVMRLRKKGRPISLLSGVDDETVWSVYHLARFSVFCSVNEGFGLPVVESLVVGTPVLTSDFGSMRELGQGNGAIVVDPHDIRVMGEAVGTLLQDDALIERLVVETHGLQRPSWDQYASTMWSIAAG